ncbi:MAG: thioredoxin domain-containing protein [Candidatus Entotheonellia bacterium]
MVPGRRERVETCAGVVQVVQVDVTAYPHITERFNIRVIPTRLIFQCGVAVEFNVGLVPNRFIVETVYKAIGTASRLKPVNASQQR